MRGTMDFRSLYGCGAAGEWLLYERHPSSSAPFCSDISSMPVAHLLFLLVFMITTKKSASVITVCGLFVFKVFIVLTHPLPEGSVELRDHGRSSGSRFILRAPSRVSPSDIMPFVLAYSGGSAGEWLHKSCTPLPYQALSGTVI
jgi:hypothetical protein